MELKASIHLVRDERDNNYVHAYLPSKFNNYYLFSIHIDGLRDLFGEFNYKILLDCLCNHKEPEEDLLPDDLDGWVKWK